VYQIGSPLALIGTQEEAFAVSKRLVTPGVEEPLTLRKCLCVTMLIHWNI